jgi:hypothetical protein
MSAVRLGLLAAFSVVVLAMSASTGSAGTTTSKSAPSGATSTNCLAHLIGGLSAAENDWSEYYTPGCTGHDEPELDPVSSAPGSARNVTWRIALPEDGTSPVQSVGPTLWFGGTVKDSNPAKLGGEGFLEMQFYPDSLVSNCTSNGGFKVKQTPGVYTVCSPVWTLEQSNKKILEPAAFNGMLMNANGTGPFVMHARDIVDVHIWAPSMTDAYREQARDETTGQTSSILVLVSPGDGPLTPAFDTNEVGNALDWGGVYDTPMSFVYEIGHQDMFGPQPDKFCVPGQPRCGSFHEEDWAGLQPLRIFDVTFGDGSHPQSWDVVSDTGGKAEVLGNSFVGPTDCTAYGGEGCIYPFFTWDGQAFNYGIDYPGNDPLGGVDQFAQTQDCPAVSVFPDSPTYCDTQVK